LTFQSQTRYALFGETDAADGLLAFEHAIVTNVDCSELEHIPRARPGNDNAARAEYVGRAALIYAPGSQNSQRPIGCRSAD